MQTNCNYSFLEDIEDSQNLVESDKKIMQRHCYIDFILPLKDQGLNVKSEGVNQRSGCVRVEGIKVKLIL